LACAAVVVARAVYIYWGNLWNNAHAINFLVAWIPSVLSVLVAFVPDKDLERRMRLRWRLAVIVCGFVYSFVLWHQQDLNDKANSAQTQNAIGSAVSEANKHADAQFGKVQTQVSEVKDDLGETEKILSSKVDQSTTTINSSLGRVGKPAPPELAKLQFSLWKEGSQSSDPPLESALLQREEDGTINVDYWFKNVSAVSAESVDIWIHICKICSFVKEPEGFEIPAGSGPHSRHRQIGSLNPGVSFQKSTVSFREDSLPTQGGAGVAKVGISFSYSCKNCGGATTTSDFMLRVLPSVGSIRQILPKT
jgi:hypothetical protein